jgi:hypothetical protein
MKERRLKKLVPAAGMAGALLAVFMLVATSAMAVHPPIQLKTYEELGSTDVNLTTNPLPYSPKQTCGSCHDGVARDYDLDGDGTPETNLTLVSYADIATMAFHADNGMRDIVDTVAGTLKSDGVGVFTADGEFDDTKGKPWNQGTGMFGKW